MKALAAYLILEIRNYVTQLIQAAVDGETQIPL